MLRIYFINKIISIYSILIISNFPYKISICRFLHFSTYFFTRLMAIKRKSAEIVFIDNFIAIHFASAAHLCIHKIPSSFIRWKFPLEINGCIFSNVSLSAIKYSLFCTQFPFSTFFDCSQKQFRFLFWLNFLSNIQINSNLQNPSTFAQFNFSNVPPILHFFNPYYHHQFHWWGHHSTAAWRP